MLKRLPPSAHLISMGSGWPQQHTMPLRGCRATERRFEALGRFQPLVQRPRSPSPYYCVLIVLRVLEFLGCCFGFGVSVWLIAGAQSFSIKGLRGDVEDAAVRDWADPGSAFGAYSAVCLPGKLHGCWCCTAGPKARSLSQRCLFLDKASSPEHC